MLVLFALETSGLLVFVVVRISGLSVHIVNHETQVCGCTPSSMVFPSTTSGLKTTWSAALHNLSSYNGILGHILCTAKGTCGLAGFQIGALCDKSKKRDLHCFF